MGIRKGAFVTQRFIIVAVLGLFAGAACSSAANNSNRATTPEELFAMAKPAVVRVFGNASAVVSWPEPRLYPAGLTALQAVVVAQVRRGEVRNTTDDIALAALRELVRDPYRYISKSNKTVTQTANTWWSGSGFIITPDGYIATNAHVAGRTEAEIQSDLVNYGLATIIGRDVKSFTDNFSVDIPQDLANQLYQVDANYIYATATMGQITSQMSVQLAKSVPGFADLGTGVPAEVTSSVGSHDLGAKDIAILKIEGKTAFPTIPIGDDTVLQVGDPLYAIGFPGAATDNPVVSDAARLEPTFTGGLVSARKSTTQGIELIQTDAAITHGSSGGPALNKQGQVIGLTTYVTNTQSQELSGFNFVVPSKILKQFVDRINVKPSSGPVTDLYRSAITAQFDQHYKTELAQLQKLNNISPGLPYVQDGIALAQGAIAKGQDRTPGTSVWLYVLIGLAALAILGLGFVFIRRRRARRPMYSVTAIPQPAAPIRSALSEPAPPLAIASPPNHSTDELIASLRGSPPELATDQAITVLATDIENPDALPGMARAAYSAIVHSQVAALGGSEVRSVDDTFLMRLPSVDAALRCAVQAQMALANLGQQEGGSRAQAQARMTIHTFLPSTDVDQEFAFALRLLDEAHGGEILASGEAAAGASDRSHFDQAHPVEVRGVSGDRRSHHVIWSRQQKVS